MKSILIITALLFLLYGNISAAGSNGTVIQDIKGSAISIRDNKGKLELILDNNNKCAITGIKVLGTEVAAPGSGAFSSVKVNGKMYNTLSELKSPTAIRSGNTVTVKNIEFGNGTDRISENWIFRPDSDFVDWTIEREYPGSMTLEDTGFPEWAFNNMETWDGALLGTGGVAWCRFFDHVDASLGSHTGKVTFWNREKNICLQIQPVINDGWHAAVRFSRQHDNKFTLNYTVSEDELRTKNFLARFIIDRQDIWDLFDARGKATVTYRLKALEYQKAMYRGDMKGINTASVGNLLNTIARVGIIDEKLMGSNNWHLDMGFVCLHEHWVAQMGLAIDDPDYLENYRKTLDYFRDNAIMPDGNVRDRWAYRMWDSSPGTFKNGFYECQWGDLFDSNTDYVMNVADLFQLNGDSAWVVKHRQSCEKALDFLLRHDSDRNGLIEVPEESHLAKKGSDWIDVIWASWESAFINAKYYNALIQWASVEEVTGNVQKAAIYLSAAAACKSAFNRPVSEGGFWDPEKNWYIYWHDKDGSIHGNNLVTPVNFMAISFGICDDPTRKKALLSKIEELMQKEKLFMWPVSFFPYQPDEGLNVNYPFPNYENGDIFLAWGEAGISAYADYDPSIPVKYIKNVLQQYEKDGLAWQRYVRVKQQGAGSDILANNCMPVVGLYHDIYGIDPRYNRLQLNPHLTPELNGTSLSYNLRDQKYTIDLSTANYFVSINSFRVNSHSAFGVSSEGNTLNLYKLNCKDPALIISSDRQSAINVETLESYPGNRNSVKWKIHSPDDQVLLSFKTGDLPPDRKYTVFRNSEKLISCTSDKEGCIRFNDSLMKGETAFYWLDEF
jgi:hypothetical protein